MKTNVFKTTSLLLLAVMAAGLIFTSCEKNPDPINLPPKESMALSLDVFPGSQSGEQKAADAAIGNWLYSWLTAVTWQTVLSVNVAVPVTAYATALNQTPVYIDGTWQWNYSVNIQGDIYTAQLVGERMNNDEYSMEMYLSKTGDDAFTDFLWFTGVVRYDRTAASWSMAYDPFNPVDYLEIDYNKNYETGVAHIRYTCVDPSSDLYQGYIEYGVDPDIEYDAYYTILSDNGETYIEWDTITSAGRVKDFNHFGDNDWHCWDSQLADVVCPAE